MRQFLFIIRWACWWHEDHEETTSIIVLYSTCCWHINCFFLMAPPPLYTFLFCPQSFDFNPQHQLTISSMFQAWRMTCKNLRKRRTMAGWICGGGSTQAMISDLSGVECPFTGCFSCERFVVGFARETSPNEKKVNVPWHGHQLSKFGGWPWFASASHPAPLQMIIARSIDWTQKRSGWWVYDVSTLCWFPSPFVFSMCTYNKGMQINNLILSIIMIHSRWEMTTKIVLTEVVEAKKQLTGDTTGRKMCESPWNHHGSQISWMFTLCAHFWTSLG